MYSSDYFFFFSSRRRHTRWTGDWSSDVCSSDLAYRQRLRDAASLYRSVQEHGFDGGRYPLLLRAVPPGAATASGKLVPRRLYGGDGCHRLALLLHLGHRTLPPAWYRVRTVAAPLDNTGQLLGPLRVPAAAYYRFLALGYAGGAPLDDRE